jgi:acyl carrier protein
MTTMTTTTTTTTLSDAELRALVLGVIATLAPETRGRAVDDAADLREVFELDSMDFLGVLVGLHRALGIALPDALAPRFFTLAGAVDALQELLRSAPGDAARPSPGTAPVASTTPTTPASPAARPR